jgi:hypothetical protein
MSSYTCLPDRTKPRCTSQEHVYRHLLLTQYPKK